MVAVQYRIFFVCRTSFACLSTVRCFETAGWDTPASRVKAFPTAIQHFMVPEEVIPLLIEPTWVVIIGKAGALRIARDGYTMRPLDEPELFTNTLLISRADNASAALSELFRGFVRKMKQGKGQDQLSLPIPI